MGFDRYHHIYQMNPPALPFALAFTVPVALALPCLFVLSRRIPACIRRKGLADWGADAETEAAAEEMLEVELKVDGPRSCSWSIDSWHILVAGSSLTSLLVRLREEFDGRLAGPGARMEAAMEAPTTAAEWRAYVELWLFGPPEPVQATLHRWLRPRA